MTTIDDARDDRTTTVPAPALDADRHTTTAPAPALDADRHTTTALTIATVLSGLFAGFFLTYSASVVLGLARVDDVTYVRTFQAINDTIRNPVFAVMFFGTAPAIAAAWILQRHADRTMRALLAIGGVLCLAVVVITFAGSVPLNNELASYDDLDAATASPARSDFEATWNLLNLIRTIVAVLGATAVATACALARRE